MCVSQGFDEEARLLLNAPLNSLRVHSKIPQHGKAEAPEWLGTLPVAHSHTWEVSTGEDRGQKQAGAGHSPPQRSF